MYVYYLDVQFVDLLIKIFIRFDVCISKFIYLAQL
ncbi:hypothetical protein FLLO111716_12315 [Flavobacterium longum]